MKQIYALGLVLLMILGVSFQASAYETTFKWDTAGAVKIYKTSISDANLIEIPAGATKYTVEYTSNTRIYVCPAEGYYLSTVEGTTAKITYSSWTGVQSWSGFLNSSSTWNGATITFTTVSSAREDEFELEIVNGASALEASFSDVGYTISNLQNGTNKIPYNPAVDKTLVISRTDDNKTALYSVTLNGGTDGISYNFYKSTATITVKEGDKVSVQVFESDEPAIENRTVTFAFDGLDAACINTIRNISASKFIELTDNKLADLPEGTQIQVNFNSEYTISKVTLGEQDLNYTAGATYVRFTVDADATLTITGKAKEYAQLPYTLFIQNPEGVNIANTYGGEAMTLPEGSAVASNITLTEGVTMTAADSKSYSLTISEKNPKLFISPKEGWYIMTVQDMSAGDSGKLLGVNFSASIISADNNKVYIVAMPYVNNAKVAVNVIGTGSASFKGDSSLSSSWDNPSTTYSVKTGENMIDFVSSYVSSFTAFTSVQPNAVYLDGKKLVANEENGSYAVSPYIPADGDASVYSTVTIFTDGTTGTMGKVNITYKDGMTADVTYSTARIATTDATISLLEGTPVYIKPAKGSEMKVGDELVYAEGKGINKLDENGEYAVSTTAAGTNVVISKEPVIVEILSVAPASGSEVKSISEIKINVPFSDDLMLYPRDATKISLSNGTTTVYATEFGELASNEMGTALVCPVTFPEVTEAGNWILTIPAGTFYEAAWDDTADDFAPVANGATTAEYTAEYTINPDAKGIYDDYTLDPADGATVKSLSVIKLTFNQLEADDHYMFYGEDGITISNGTTTYPCAASGNSGAINIFIMDNNYEDVTITENGKWTLNIPAGAISKLGAEETIPGITATYTVSDSSAIDSILSDSDENVTVYGIDGRLILKDAPRAELNGLAKGLYIINGQKVLVK